MPPDESFTDIVKTYKIPVYRFLRSLLKHRENADDAFQQTFLNVYEKRHTFRGESSIKTWIFTIARRCAFSLLKKERVHHAKPQSLLELGYGAGWSSEQPDLAAQRAESKVLLHKALQSLKPEMREILILRELKCLNGAETAELLGISLAAMKTRLHRARLSLAIELRKEDVL